MRTLIAAAICLSLASLTNTAEGDAVNRKPTHIPAQDLGLALKSFAQARELYLIFAAQDVSELRTHGATGELTADEALRRLLDGTGLTYRYIDANTVSIMPIDKDGNASLRTISATGRDDARVWRLAQARSVPAGMSASDVVEQNASADADGRRGRASSELEEIVVTGSHIRGVQNTSSPVITFDRTDIEQGGFATTQQLIQKLPQNLNNVSDMTFGSVNGSPDLTYNGSGVNLRGLGSDASLVLLNGRRMAATGQGNFVDISLVPLSAIERVDVLTDGASAIYGSDAVGGVVNLVLRNDFEGAETRLRYGSVTEGSHQELQAGQAVGHAWSSGHAFVSYEYHRQTALDGSDRDVFRPVGNYMRLALIPEQTRHGALAVVSQRLSDDIALAGELFHGIRKANHGYQLFSSWSDVDTEVSQTGGNLGLNVDVAGEWQVRLSGQFNRSESESLFYSGSGMLDTVHHNESRMRSADLSADGPLAQAPGGAIRLAIGSHFREEEFEEEHSFGSPVRIDRDVVAAYAELIVPWVSEENRRPGLERLQLTLAGRYEDYSDFGNTFNPKIGASWAPANGVNVRGTWGTSFKAPLLRQLNVSNTWGYLYTDAFADVSGGTTPTLWLNGYGVPLGPEESTNWTVGIDLAPAAIKGFELSASYFDIDYKDRISTPFPAGYDIYGALLDPAYSMVVTRNPNPAAVAALLQGLEVYCFTPDYDPGCANIPPPGDIRAIVDDRYRNLAGVRMKGIDFSIGHRWDSGLGSWSVQLSGTHLLENVERIVASTPKMSRMNDVWRPVDLRLRNSVSLARGPLNVTAFLNYTDGYRDSRAGSSSRAEVASWTTVDLTLQYDLSRIFASNGLDSTSLTLSAVNLFDRDPPYVNSVVGLNFDGVNANPLGRFVAAQLAVRW